MSQVPLILLPEDLGLQVKYKALFDYEPSSEDISDATKAMGYDPENITFIHIREIKSGEEQGLWRTLWVLKK